jgi:hypothetical protein
MNDIASKNRSPETHFKGGNFFAQKFRVRENETHPNDVIRMLKDELARSQEHVYELYIRIADYAKHYEDENKEKKSR